MSRRSDGSHALPKLTRPTLSRTVRRERLFSELDKRIEHGVVWVHAPPGAGKTSLVSSYVAARSLQTLWYQLDRLDADPATFFYFLREAGIRTHARRDRLPRFASEYLRDVRSFARRFFRELFAGAAARTVLVLDNYQEIEADSPLHMVLAVGMDEVCAEASLIVISREGPPKEYARLRLAERIALLDGEDLRLTKQEVADLLNDSRGSDAQFVDALLQRTQGWAAGVVLLDRALRTEPTADHAALRSADRAAFDYFATQVFDAIDADDRRLLIFAALLPYVTDSTLVALSGDAAAERVLASLYRRQLFVDRRPGTPPRYHLHALFRTFLLDLAQQQLAPDAFLEKKRRAAEVVLAAGEWEAALELFVECAEWSRAEALLIACAPSIIEHGRWLTLQHFSQRLPAARRTANLWLRYWVNVARTAFAPGEAATELQAVYEDFLAAGNEYGQLLTATAIIDALYLQFSDFRAMDRWIDRLVALMQAGVTPRSPEDDLRINAAVMIAATYREPNHTRLQECVRRVMSLLLHPFPAHVKVAIASALHAYGNMATDREAENRAVEVASPLLDSPALPARTLALYLFREAYTHYIHGRYAACITCLQRADPIARDGDLRDVRVMLGNMRGLAHRRAGRLGDARASMYEVENLGPDLSLRGSVHHLLRASVAFAGEDLPQAVDEILVACARADECGYFNSAILIHSVATNFAIAAGRFELAARLLRDLQARTHGPFGRNHRGVIRIHDAWLAYRKSDTAGCLTALQDAFALCSDPKQRFRLRWYANALAELLPFALQHGLDAAIAARLIEDFSVTPPRAPVEAWPWPVKVRTLGGFEVLVNCRPVVYSRKQPKKVLATLKAVIALGGNDVPEQILVDALWPDADGDAAHRALVAIVHRLRLLFGDGSIVHHRAGLIGLDPCKCWVDALAFERMSKEGQAHTPVALALYRGAFLPSAADEPWILQRRKTLRAIFVEAVRRAAGDLERNADFDAAARVYARAIEADDVVEDFHAGLARVSKAAMKKSAAHHETRNRETPTGQFPVSIPAFPMAGE